MTNGNEPAFSMIDGQANYMSPGLSKREYFAAMALQGLLSGNNNFGFTKPDIDHAAQTSVDISDALIKALNENSSVQ